GLELAATAGGLQVPTAGEAHVGIAGVLYERDEVDEALRHVEAGVELCRHLMSAQPLATGLATLAWIRQARGDGAAALEAMEEAYRVLPGAGVVSLVNPVPAERARLLLARGLVAEAAAWAEERGLREGDEPVHATEREHLVLGRLLLARGEPDRALGLLRRLRAVAEAQGRTPAVSETRV